MNYPILLALGCFTFFTSTVGYSLINFFVQCNYDCSRFGSYFVKLFGYNDATLDNALKRGNIGLCNEILSAMYSRGYRQSILEHYLYLAIELEQLPIVKHIQQLYNVDSTDILVRAAIQDKYKVLKYAIEQDADCKQGLFYVQNMDCALLLVSNCKNLDDMKFYCVPKEIKDMILSYSSGKRKIY